MKGTSWTVAGMVLASTPEPRPRSAASCSASSRRSLGSACRFPVGHFEEYLEAGGLAEPLAPLFQSVAYMLSVQVDT